MATFLPNIWQRWVPLTDLLQITQRLAYTLCVKLRLPNEQMTTSCRRWKPNKIWRLELAPEKRPHSVGQERDKRELHAPFNILHRCRYYFYPFTAVTSHISQAYSTQVIFNVRRFGDINSPDLQAMTTRVHQYEKLRPTTCAFYSSSSYTCVYSRYCVTSSSQLVRTHYTMPGYSALVP